MSEGAGRPDGMIVDQEARWKEIQAMSKAIAYRDEPPTPVESALCGAVVRAQEWKRELADCRAELAEAKELLASHHVLVPLTSHLAHASPRTVYSLTQEQFDELQRDAISWRSAHAEREEPEFILNGSYKKCRSLGVWVGKPISYDDLVEWSGLDSDREVIRERVYTVTYSIGHGPEHRGGSLTKGQSVPFDKDWMAFNVTRTSKA